MVTDLTLTKDQCGKLAAIAHDGLARAVNPAHTMFDGDLFFGGSTATEPAPDPGHFYALLAATADIVTRAFGRGLRRRDVGQHPVRQLAVVPRSRSVRAGVGRTMTEALRLRATCSI